ncbi:MAG: hypothetical protein ACRDSS_03105 [Actinocrinis sp.]
MQLTQRCDLWRMVGRYDEGKTLQAVYTQLACLRVPISSFDKIAGALLASSRSSAPSENFRPEGRQSTDIFLIAAWVAVQADDELRHGRRVDINGNAVQYRYRVGGVQAFDGLGYQDRLAVFCQSLR